MRGAALKIPGILQLPLEYLVNSRLQVIKDSTTFWSALVPPLLPHSIAKLAGRAYDTGTCPKVERCGPGHALKVSTSSELFLAGHFRQHLAPRRRIALANARDRTSSPSLPWSLHVRTRIASREPRWSRCTSWLSLTCMRWPRSVRVYVADKASSR